MSNNTITKHIRSTLINIDSSFRVIKPINKYETNGQYLSPNSLQFTKDSNDIIVTMPNHNLTENDKVIVQNVKGKSKILINSFYLFDGFDYLVINYGAHNLDTNYLSYIDAIYVNVKIHGDMILGNYIENIPINSFIGKKEIFLASDVNKTSSLDVIKPYINFLSLGSGTSITNGDLTLMNQNLLFIKLPYRFNMLNGNVYVIGQAFEITNLFIGSIPLGYINANYPITNNRYQGYHNVYLISDSNNIIDNNHFIIKSKIKSSISINEGGNIVQVMKIINTIDGYPNANDYIIYLKKTFTNVINIKLVSMEMPYVDLLIKKNINDKLYWNNLEDGEYEYSIQIEEGAYDYDTLIQKIKTKMNNTKKITSTNEVEVYNLFDIKSSAKTQEITFISYNKINLPNSLSLSKVSINNVEYFSLTITHPNNVVSIGDEITINNSEDLTYTEVNNDTGSLVSNTILIKSSYFNKTHIVYSVDGLSRTYTCLIAPIDQVFFEPTTNTLSGGKTLEITTKGSFRLLFNIDDTIGDILGFRSVGEDYAITDYKSEIKNDDDYIGTINLNSVGDEIDYNNLINLSGPYNYMLMYMNDIEFIYSNNNQTGAFAKILLSGEPGDILFNTQVPQPDNSFSPVFPINTLSQLNIKLTFPDGTMPDFRNLNHSMTLRIDEEISQTSNTRLSSKNITYLDELKKST